MIGSIGAKYLVLGKWINIHEISIGDNIIDE
jgi:hypothetical protein